MTAVVYSKGNRPCRYAISTITGSGAARLACGGGARTIPGRSAGALHRGGRQSRSPVLRRDLTHEDELRRWAIANGNE